tara:strand:+ start:9635 stop:10699 length:1065 start_codon:yes stop_codon:yes gene_type:complete
MRNVLIVGILLVMVAAQTVHAKQLVILSLGADQKLVVYELVTNDGTLTKQSSVDTSGKPGAMCMSSDGHRVYVAMKGTGMIAAYQFTSDDDLVLLNEIAVGMDPSYLSLDPSGKFLVGAYYSTGQVTVHSTDATGKVSGEPLQRISTDERAHAAVFDRSGKFVFVPHTRPNAIFQFRFDAPTGMLTANDPPKLLRDADTGPRHLWFHPGNQYAFGSDEQGSSITGYRFDHSSGQLTTMQTLSSLPATGFEGRNSTADIEVHPSGEFVYIANRGHDTIAGYSISETTGRLTFLGRTPTESVTRSFNIAPDGRHLIAAGQKSGKLAVFQIHDDGSLVRTQTVMAGENPWWVLIVER